MSINGPLDSEQLTHREREVLRLARDGRTNSEIATELGISRNAVRYHLKELHSKFETGGVRSSLVARWRRALALPTFPAAKLGVPLTTALFAGGIALTGVAAMRYAPANLGSSTGDQATNACPTEFYAGTMTLSDFAFGNVTIEDLRALNPGIPDGPVAPDTVIRVPFDPSRECGEANMTPAGSMPKPGGTPFASAEGHMVGDAIPTPVD